MCKLETTLSTGTALDVTVLKDNNKLTRLYTGMPTYDYSFLAIVDYLEPKAKEMIAWNSSKTKELDISGKQSGPRCFFWYVHCKPVVFSTHSTQTWFACCRCLRTI